jgi:hypothetical protein
VTLYEEEPPAVRVGEWEIGGRRACARVLPYVGGPEESSIRFDPVERVFQFAPPEPRIGVGPHREAAWRSAIGRVPAGPVLIGPCAAAEEIHGAYRAAATGARASGRGAYLLDPEPSGLPDAPEEAFVVLFAWNGADDPVPKIAGAAKRGFRSGVLLPVIPGWTADAAFLQELLARLAAAGCHSVTAIAPRHDGEARRRIVEARGESEGFFEQVHHLDWEAALPAALDAVRSAVGDHGLALLPPRPAAPAEPAGNARAAARLEERAAAARDDHRFALLHAAARWIDESGRDLRAVLAEGNFRKVFPFAPEVAAEAEKALMEPPS